MDLILLGLSVSPVQSSRIEKNKYLRCVIQRKRTKKYIRNFLDATSPIKVPSKLGKCRSQKYKNGTQSSKLQ